MIPPPGGGDATGQRVNTVRASQMNCYGMTYRDWAADLSRRLVEHKGVSNNRVLNRAAYGRHRQVVG